MKNLLIYSAIALGVLFTFAQFAAHLPERYHRGSAARPYTLRERLREACDGWWTPLATCSFLYAIGVPFVFLYGVWKHRPGGFVLDVYARNWKVLVGLAAVCIIQEIGKGLDLAAEDSETFKQQTNRRLAAMERKLWGEVPSYEGESEEDPD